VSTPSHGPWLDDYFENPPKKKLVAFGADEPNSSERTKGLKEGVFQMWGEGRGWSLRKKGKRQKYVSFLFGTQSKARA